MYLDEGSLVLQEQDGPRNTDDVWDELFGRILMEIKVTLI